MIKSGVNVCIPIHTTHKHIEGFDWPVGVRLVDAWHYASGQTNPHYPMPAIKTLTEYIPHEANHPARGSLIISELYKCNDCGIIHEKLACVWDFNFDRCQAFHLKVGCYTNRHQLKLAIEIYNHEREGGSLS